MFGSARPCILAVFVLLLTACAPSRPHIPWVESGTYALSIHGLPPGDFVFDVSPTGHVVGNGDRQPRCEGDLTEDENQQLTAAVNAAAVIARGDEDTSCVETDCGVFRICITWMDDGPHCFLYTSQAAIEEVEAMLGVTGAVLRRLAAEARCGPL